MLWCVKYLGLQQVMIHAWHVYIGSPNPTSTYQTWRAVQAVQSGPGYAVLVKNLVTVGNVESN